MSATAENQRRCALAAAPHVSLSLISKILRSVDSVAGSRMQFQREIAKDIQTTTPYGPLCMKMPLQGVDFEWEHANPFAYVWLLCHCNPHFGSFLKACYENADNKLRRIAIYSDETTPGNQLAPDNRRSVQTYYWTFLFLPGWFRRRKHGWWTFGIMKVSDEKLIEGGLSCMVKKMLTVFFPPTGFNFAVGMRLQSGDETFTIRATLAANIVDMKAHQKTLDVKGSAGWHCCIKCKNVLNVKRQRIATSDYLQHYSTASLQQRDLNTDEDYWEMADVLEAARPMLGDRSKTKFKELEKRLGVNHNPNGILLDKHLRKYFLPVTHSMEDWAHCIYASGGFGQYEIQQFCIAIRAVRVDMVQKLDSFAAGIRRPNGTKLLPKDFFTRRMSTEDDGHIKCFMQETINAVTACRQFCQMVLQPAGRLPKHCECMRLLSEITCLLLSGDRLVQHTDILEQKSEQHRRLSLQVYGEDWATPKLHQFGHVAESIAKVGANLDTRHMEKKHNAIKGTATHVMRHTKADVTVLHRLLWSEQSDMAGLSESEFSNCHLVNPQVAPADLAFILEAHLGERISQTAHTSRQMFSSVGKLTVGDLLQFSLAGGRAFGIARLFVSCQALGSTRTATMVVFSPLVQALPRHWQPASQLALASAQHLITLCYREVGEYIEPVLPELEL